MPNLRFLQIDLTDQCPLFCLHCSNSSGPSLNSGLSLDTVNNIILDAAKLGCSDVVLSGGEPFCHPQFDQILSLCKALKLRTTVFTTGMRDVRVRDAITATEWRNLAMTGLNTVVFSVYAPPAKREFHNWVVRLKPRGAIDAFEVNEQGIRSAIHAGISTDLQFIPTRETYTELGRVYSWASSLGVARLHLQYPTLQGRNKTTAAVVVEENTEHVLRIAALGLSDRQKPRLHVSRFWRRKWGLPDQPERPHQAIVRADGFVSLCNACKYKHAALAKNVRQESLAEIWADEVWRNAKCDCTNHGAERNSEATAAPRRSDLQFVRADELLASGAKRSERQLGC